MSDKIEDTPITVPTEFGESVVTLADEPSAKLETEKPPFVDLPLRCGVTLYEPPGATLAHVAKDGKGPESGGVWLLMADGAVQKLASHVAEQNCPVEFVREESRFREALANEYWTPEDGGDDE